MKVISKKERSLFAAALENLLAYSGLFPSKAKWAKFLGVSEVAISNWLTDKNAPRPEHLNSILDLFKEDRQFSRSVRKDIETFYEMASHPLIEVTPIPQKFKNAKTVDTYMLKPKLSVYFVELATLPASVQENLIFFNTKLCRKIDNLISIRHDSTKIINNRITQWIPKSLLDISNKTHKLTVEKETRISDELYVLSTLLHKVNRFPLNDLWKQAENCQVTRNQFSFDLVPNATEILYRTVNGYINELSEQPSALIGLRQVVHSLEDTEASDWLLMFTKAGWKEQALPCLPSVYAQVGIRSYLVWKPIIEHFEESEFIVKQKYSGGIWEIQFQPKTSAEAAFEHLCKWTNVKFSKIEASDWTSLQVIFHSQIAGNWKDYYRGHIGHLGSILSDKSEQLIGVMGREDLIPAY